MKPIIYLVLMSLTVAWADLALATDFIAPSNCNEVIPTGGASSDLATEGDPPVVEVYIPRFTVPSVPADIISIVREGGDWYVNVNAPETGDYYIQAVYTPFLQTFQTLHLGKGESGYILLSRLSNGTPGHPTQASLEVNAGQKYAGGFIEFSASIRASEPFTMQLDEFGKVMTYCLAANPNGYSVTVYDAQHEFVGTGSVNNSGIISWDSFDAQ